MLERVEPTLVSINPYEFGEVHIPEISRVSGWPYDVGRFNRHQFLFRSPWGDESWWDGIKLSIIPDGGFFIHFSLDSPHFIWTVGHRKNMKTVSLDEQKNLVRFEDDRSRSLVIARDYALVKGPSSICKFFPRDGN